MAPRLRQLDMFDQCRAKRRGTKEPMRPHGKCPRPCTNAVHATTNFAVVPVARQQVLNRLDRLAGRDADRFWEKVARR